MPVSAPIVVPVWDKGDMLIKRIVLLVAIFTLSLSVPTLAAEPDSGVIEGQLVNGTEGGSSVADQEIALQTYLNDTEVKKATTRTDAEGRFVFDGLSTEPGYSYQITLNFQQADYSSDWLSFDGGETSKFTEITVYDSTTSDEAITVVNAHTIIYVEQDSLQVKEYFFFANMSDRTYIGSNEIDTEGTRETLKFYLPSEATELQPGNGLMGCCIYDSEDGFVDSMPVLPGSKEVVYSYRVDYNSGAYTFSRNVNYSIMSYNFLVQGEGSNVISDQLIVEEPLDISGIRFNHLSGGDFTPGDTVVAQISGLPNTGSQGIIIWVVLALGVLVGGFGFSYLLRKRRLQPVRAKASPDRQKLLVELAQLDDEFESGKIDEEVYRRLRAKKKSQLVALLQKKNSGNG